MFGDGEAELVGDAEGPHLLDERGVGDTDRRESEALLGLLRGGTGLLDELDKALSEKDDAKRAVAYKSAGKTAGGFFKMLRSDPRVSALADNPIAPVPAIGDMQRALAPLVKTLT